jgi:hypothetical protein
MTTAVLEWVSPEPLASSVKTRRRASVAIDAATPRA